MRRPSSLDDQRVAMLADADGVDHPPELLERDLADDPADVLLRLRQPHRDRRRRQQVVVDAHRRDVGVFRAVPRLLRDCQLGRAERARRERRTPALSNTVISRNSGNCEDVVLEGPFLLPRGQPGRPELGADRLEHARVVAHVHADLLGDLLGDVEIALPHRCRWCRSGATRPTQRRRATSGRTAAVAMSRTKREVMRLTACLPGAAAGRHCQRFVRISRFVFGGDVELRRHRAASAPAT